MHRSLRVPDLRSLIGKNFRLHNRQMERNFFFVWHSCLRSFLREKRKQDVVNHFRWYGDTRLCLHDDTSDLCCRFSNLYGRRRSDMSEHFTRRVVCARSTGTCSAPSTRTVVEPNVFGIDFGQPLNRHERDRWIVLGDTTAKIVPQTNVVGVRPMKRHSTDQVTVSTAVRPARTRVYTTCAAGTGLTVKLNVPLPHSSHNSMVHIDSFFFGGGGGRGEGKRSREREVVRREREKIDFDLGYWHINTILILYDFDMIAHVKCSELSTCAMCTQALYCGWCPDYNSTDAGAFAYNVNGNGRTVSHTSGDGAYKLNRAGNCLSTVGSGGADTRYHPRCDLVSG
jgi:hypothetical protein